MTNRGKPWRLPSVWKFVMQIRPEAWASCSSHCCCKCLAIRGRGTCSFSCLTVILSVLTDHVVEAEGLGGRVLIAFGSVAFVFLFLYGKVLASAQHEHDTLLRQHESLSSAELYTPTPRLSWMQTTVDSCSCATRSRWIVMQKALEEGQWGMHGVYVCR
ncbi:unnamed protein product [Amoebophrya sp. A120]|nr:unnamed protein product [Amoebophrya sp. A120]|eukprot:GSA120T00025729001.1